MVKLNTYKVMDNVTPTILSRFGFQKTSRGYMHKFDLGHNIGCKVFVDDDMIRSDVYDSFTESLYWGFYNPSMAETSKVIEDLYRNYNREMNRYVGKVFIRVADDTTPPGSEVIKVKYFADIDPLTVNPKGDLIDLRSAETVDMVAGNDYMIPLGVGMKLPEGYKAAVYPRSSMFKNYHCILVNSVGQIDGAYCGDDDQWFAHVYCFKDAVIHKNDRICQFEIVRRQPTIKFETVDSLNNESRGGFGSTGVA